VPTQNTTFCPLCFVSFIMNLLVLSLHLECWVLSTSSYAILAFQLLWSLSVLFLVTHTILWFSFLQHTSRHHRDSCWLIYFLKFELIGVVSAWSNVHHDCSQPCTWHILSNFQLCQSWIASSFHALTTSGFLQINQSSIQNIHVMSSSICPLVIETWICFTGLVSYPAQGFQQFQSECHSHLFCTIVFSITTYTIIWVVLFKSMWHLHVCLVVPFLKHSYIVHKCTI
jgi:hypothetical protein